MPLEILIPDYRPSPRQTKFHQSKAFETLYGGAAGGGKTAALCAEGITAALEQPGTHVYLFRRTLKELEQSDYIEIMSQIAPYQNVDDSLKEITIKYNGTKSRFDFSNGSFIQLAYLDTPKDRYRYQSVEIHLLLIDELTHFTEDDYEYLKTRVRASDKRRLRIMCSTNPGGIGHGWVKLYFIDNAKPETIYKAFNPDTEATTTRQFIPARVDDHPSVIFRANYMKVLDAIKDPALRKALRDGDWDTFSGQVFTEWRVGTHVIEALPVSPEEFATWPKYIGYDWGFRDPACAIWIAEAPENEYGVRALYAYRELYMGQLSPEEWAQMIATYIIEEPIQYMVLPHDCFSHLGGNRTIASVFEEHDIPIVRADSLSHAAKMHRAALLHQLLNLAPDGFPYLQVHIHCANLTRTLPQLPYSDTKPEEIDDNAEDHAFDSLTYGLMVITKGRSYVVNPLLPNSRPLGYIASKDGMPIDGQYDPGKAVAALKNDARDWRYR